MYALINVMIMFACYHYPTECRYRLLELELAAELGQQAASLHLAVVPASPPRDAECAGRAHTIAAPVCSQ